METNFFKNRINFIDHTNQLANEISVEADHIDAIVLAFEYRDIDGNINTKYRYHGSINTCLGMARTIDDLLLNAVKVTT